MGDCIVTLTIVTFRSLHALIHYTHLNLLSLCLRLRLRLCLCLRLRLSLRLSDRMKKEAGVV